MKILVLFIMTIFATNVAATSPKDAYAMVKNGTAVMVDVRERNEINHGIIDKALWLPTSRINADSNWLNEFKMTVENKKIFIYCRSGNRSGKFQEILKAKGIASENLGGFEDLKSVLPVIQAK